MVIPGHNLGNSQVSVYRTIGPTLVCFTDFFRNKLGLEDELEIKIKFILTIFHLN